MKRFYSLALIITCLFLLASCVTSGTLPSDVAPSSVSGAYEDENIKITVDSSYVTGGEVLSFASCLRVKITNKSNTLVSFDVDNSAYISLGANSERMVDGETKKIDINKPQVSYAIAPNSSITRDLYSPDNPELGFSFPERSKVLIAYQMNDKLNFAEIELKDENEMVTGKVGEVKVSKKQLHLLFNGETNPEKAKEKALTKAKNTYGDNVMLTNIQYSTRWSPLSFLVWYNLLGYVDNIDLTADVVRYAYN